jgi:putative spermidine/putrescine transport system ATP-binding protein
MIAAGRSRSGTGLVLDGLTKRYGTMVALDNLSLTVEPGAFQALLGPSGSGKTSLLMSVAGFLTLDVGRILVNGWDVSGRQPEERNFGMVFQGYALFPHMTVLDNVAFSLRARGVPKAERHKRAGTAIDMVRLTGLEKRLPRELSGGQQQRVALARAIVFEPDLLLLDEPLSALDRQLRGELQWELRALQRQIGLTCLYVTHDQEEALSMADSVAVLNGGKLIQVGAPSDLYEHPASEFVANFLGKSNFLKLHVLGTEGNRTVCGKDHITLFHCDEATGRKPGTPILLALRPEKLILTSRAVADPTWNVIDAEVVDASYYGGTIEMMTDASVLGRLFVRAPANGAAAFARPGQKITLAWPPDASVEVTPQEA